MTHARSAQRKVFEEVAGTRWAAREATFSRASKHVMTDIEIGRRGSVARVWVDDATLVAPMERAGYAVRDQSGERALRGVGDVIEERAMLERAVSRPDSIRAWPRRRPRKIARVERRVDMAIVRSMKDSTWTWTVTEVARDGAPTFVDGRIWRAHAWCLVVDEDGSDIEMGIRLGWRKKPAGPEMRDARKRLAAALAPFGYVSANVRGEIVVEKSVRTVAEARDERARLDRFLG